MVSRLCCFGKHLAFQFIFVIFEVSGVLTRFYLIFIGFYGIFGGRRCSDDVNAFAVSTGAQHSTARENIDWMSRQPGISGPIPALTVRTWCWVRRRAGRTTWNP